MVDFVFKAVFSLAEVYLKQVCFFLRFCPLPMLLVISIRKNICDFSWKGKKPLPYSCSSLPLLFLTAGQKRKRSARIFLCDNDYYTDIPRVNHVCYSLSNLPTEKGRAEHLRGRSVFYALSFLYKLLISAVRQKYLYEVFSRLHLFV